MDNELAFYTNRQLLKELIGRKSFVGMVLTSKEELYKQDKIDGVYDFVLLSNANLIPSQILDILTQGAMQAKQVVGNGNVETININDELY